MVKVRHVLLGVTYATVPIALATVFRYVHPYALVAFALLAALAGAIKVRPAWRIDRWALNAVSVMIIVASFARVSPQQLVEPILEGLLLLLGIKLIEAERYRDFMQIYALCVFLLLGSTLISVSMIFLAYFIPLAVLLTIALILLAYDEAGRDLLLPWKAVVKTAALSLLICVMSIPTLVLLFLILPRTNYPLFMFLNQQHRVRSGFSDRVELGGIASIQEDNHVVFRAVMPRIDDSALYWRGIVLDSFDGRSWTNSGQNPARRPYRVTGTPVHQVIFLEPYGNRYLFGLDKPVNVQQPQAQRAGALTYQLPQDISKRMRYEVDSLLSDRMNERDSGNYRSFLQLPDTLSIRILRLARRLAAGKTERERVKNIWRFLHDGSFRYSLVDLPSSRSPLEAFLFEHKRGNCEFFASALATLLRLCHIPARLVAGYKGGYYNPAGGYYLVLQKHAHVWAEAYLAGTGWLRLDPTPYALLRPSDLYLESLSARIRVLFDVFNYYWFKLVVNYDLNRQLHYLARIRRALSPTNWRWQRPSLPRPPAALLVVLLILLPAAILVRFRRQRRNRIAYLVSRFQKTMRRHGYTMETGEGLEEFVERIEQPELRRRAWAFVEAVEEVVYGDRHLEKRTLAQLYHRLREIR